MQHNDRSLLRAWVWTLGIFTFSLASVSPTTLVAQNTPRTHAWFETQYRYLDIKPSSADLERLDKAWTQATATGLDMEQRGAMFQALLTLMIEVQGVEDAYPGGPPPQMLARANELAGLEAPADPLPVETSKAPFGTLRTHGDGPIPILLVGGNVPADLAFDDFLNELDGAYTVYAVSLPGIGGLPALPLPARRNYEDAAWMRTVQQGLLDLITERELDRPVVIGHDIGAWIALDLAVRQPERLRALMMIDPAGLPGPISRRGAGYASLEERRARGRAVLPEVLPEPPKDQRVASLMPWASGYAQDPERVQPVLDAFLATHPTVTQRYRQEMASMDRQAALKRLEVPTILGFSLQDEQSALWGNPHLNLGWWQTDRLAAPDAPIRIVRFDDLRQPFLDHPHRMHRALDDFLADRTIEGGGRDSSRNFRHASSWRQVNANIALTDIGINYYAPRARDRELFGQVVPWDQVWRAGANEATRLSLSHSVRLGGQDLAAGEYSLFVIPRAEDPWTLIVNRIAYQWGSFAYDPTHDALRLELEPEDMETWEDVLRFDIAEKTIGRGELILAWGKHRLRAEVLALEGLQWVPGTDTGRLAKLQNWLELAQDATGDAVNGPWLHDGKALSVTYECAEDRIWFRFDLASAPSQRQLGLNIAVDGDLDLTTGSPWWGANRGVTFDRLLTLWVEGSSEHGYVGDIGISNDAEAMAGHFAKRPGGLDFGVDAQNHRLYLGVAADDLDDDGELALVATVGTDTVWTDDLIDQGQAHLSLKDLRQHASCL